MTRAQVRVFYSMTNASENQAVGSSTKKEGFPPLFPADDTKSLIGAESVGIEFASK
ncbi:hypothetical protein ABID47_001104 [Paenibacillus favisporus]|uniref:Uncharacterized protein n=1 Tax=Paenibacillus favisporus TaxID=221028 RepID=A0ABV2EYA7_9BACL